MINIAFSNAEKCNFYTMNLFGNVSSNGSSNMENSISVLRNELVYQTHMTSSKVASALVIKMKTSYPNSFGDNLSI